MLKATVSGSFHRHMPAIYGAVAELRGLGVDVISPADPRVVDYIGEFLFVASDRLRSVKLVQDRHFAAIRASDFLWVVCPDGYTGASTSAEIGAAYASGVPVFSDHLPLDITLQHYVRKVPSIQVLIERLRSPEIPQSTGLPHFLLAPEHAVEGSIKTLERLKAVMLGLRATGRGEAEREVDAAKRALRASLDLDRPG